MKDAESVIQITDLLDQANEAEVSGDENNQRLNLEKMFALFKELSPHPKKNLTYICRKIY